MGEIEAIDALLGLELDRAMKGMCPGDERECTRFEFHHGPHDLPIDMKNASRFLRPTLEVCLRSEAV